jgi:hypothetical protein
MKLRFLLVVAALFWTVTCRAAEIDFSHVLMNEDGEPWRDPFAQKKDDPDCAKCPVLTLGMAAAHALVNQYPEEHDLDPLQKWARGNLAMELRRGKKETLSAEEIAVIKRLIGKVYGPDVIMQAYPILDPDEKPPTIK